MGPLSLAMSVVLAGAFLALSGGPQLVDGCSCSRPKHPQAYACHADFVIVARVKSMHSQPKEGTRTFKVLIKKELQANEKAKAALKSGRLLTPFHSASCGTQLTQGETYLIVGRVWGGKASINMCSYIKPWKNVSMRERKGFRLLYKMGCDCQIEDCSGFGSCSSEASNDSCQLTSGCESVCTRHPGGKCGWLQNKAQKECMKEGSKLHPFFRLYRSRGLGKSKSFT